MTAWIVSGVLGAGYSYGFCQNMWQLIADAQRREDSIFICIFSITGPIMLIALVLVGVLEGDPLMHFRFGWLMPFTKPRGKNGQS